ncbi:YceI family protein [Corynebacterium riegelii]
MTALTGTWNLDTTHSTIGFVVRHAMVSKVRGTFNDFNSTITVAENIADSKATATIQAASADTRNADRDAHLRTEDFFNTDAYPEITFTSTEVNVDASGNGTLTGDLTIKGVTKPVTLNVETFGVEEAPTGETRWGFEANTTIDRTEFGIDFNAPMNSGGVLLSKEIKVEIEGSAVKAD